MGILGGLPAFVVSPFRCFIDAKILKLYGGWEGVEPLLLHLVEKEEAELHKLRSATDFGKALEDICRRCEGEVVRRCLASFLKNSFLDSLKVAEIPDFGEDLAQAAEVEKRPGTSGKRSSGPAAQTAEADDHRRRLVPAAQWRVSTAWLEAPDD